MHCLGGYFSRSRRTMLLLLCVAFLPSPVQGCPLGCTCGDKTECTITTDWDDIPDQLSPSASFIKLSCQSPGRIRKLNGVEMYTNVKELLVNNCKLIQIFAGQFSSLTRLVKLDLSNNAIIAIPPGAFEKLVNLKTLTLSNNQIEDVPSSAFEPLGKLQTLEISSNKISLMSAESMVGLESVKVIKMDENKMSDISGIFKIKTLEELSMSNNALTTIKPDYFSSLTSLTMLTLIQNNIESISVGALNLQNIESIYLGKNKIRELRNNMFDSNLRYLNLEDNQIQTIPEGFFDYFKSMTGCILSGNPLHCDCDMKWFKGYLSSREGLFKQETWHQLPECETPRKAPFSDYLEDQFECVKPNIVEITGNTSNPICRATGKPPPWLTWTFSANDNEVVSQDPPSNRTAADNSITLPLEKATDSGYYTCIARNVAGTVNSSLYIQIAPSGGGSLPQNRLTAVVIGGILAVLFVIAICVIILLMHLRKQRLVQKDRGRRDTGLDTGFDTVPHPARKKPNPRRSISEPNGTSHYSASPQTHDFGHWPGESVDHIGSKSTVGHKRPRSRPATTIGVGHNRPKSRSATRTAEDHEKPRSRPATTGRKGHVNQAFIDNDSYNSQPVKISNNKHHNMPLPPTPDDRGIAIAKVMTPGFGALERRIRSDDEYETLDQYFNNPGIASISEYSELPLPNNRNFVVQKATLNFEEET